MPTSATLVDLRPDGSPDLSSARHVHAADVAVGQLALVKPGEQVRQLPLHRLSLQTLVMYPWTGGAPLTWQWPSWCWSGGGSRCTQHAVWRSRLVRRDLLPLALATNGQDGIGTLAPKSGQHSAEPTVPASAGRPLQVPLDGEVVHGRALVSAEHITGADAGRRCWGALLQGMGRA